MEETVVTVNISECLFFVPTHTAPGLQSGIVENDVTKRAHSNIQLAIVMNWMSGR